MSDPYVYWPEHEPSEADNIIEEYKEALRNEIKEEFQGQIKVLGQVNKDLHEKLSNLHALEREATHKIRTANEVVKHAEEKARKKLFDARARDLLEVLTAPRYRIERSYRKLPRCGRCNIHRERPYTSPMGRAKVEACDCAKSITTYTVEPVYVVHVTFEKGLIKAEYKAKPEGDEAPIILSWYSQSSEDQTRERLETSPLRYHYPTRDEALRVLALHYLYKKRIKK